MKQLLEDYQRRLATITAEIEKLGTNCPSNEKYNRMRTKQGCYRTIIAELERAMSKPIMTEDEAEEILKKQNWDTTITLPFNQGFIKGLTFKHE